MAAHPNDHYRSAAELAAAAQLALTAAPYRGGPSTKPTSPDAPLPGPSDGVTKTIQLPHAPATANPAQRAFDPVQGRSPTVSYSHSRPVPLAVPPLRRRRRYIAPAIAIFVIVGAVVAGAIAIPRFVGDRATRSPATTGAVTHTYTGKPTDVPFPGLDIVKSLTIDSAGNVYVLSSLTAARREPVRSLPSKLMKLAAGATKTTMLEFPDLNFRAASDLEADAAGNIYFSVGSQVWELPAGASIPTRLPFRGFVTIAAIAVDTAGNVRGRLAARRQVRVRRQEAGTRRQQADRFGLPEHVPAARNGGQSRRRRLYLLVHRGSRRRPGPPTPGRLHHGQQLPFPGLPIHAESRLTRPEASSSPTQWFPEFSSCRPD